MLLPEFGIKVWLLETIALFFWRQHLDEG